MFPDKLAISGADGAAVARARVVARQEVLILPLTPSHELNIEPEAARSVSSVFGLPLSSVEIVDLHDAA